MLQPYVDRGFDPAAMAQVRLLLGEGVPGRVVSDQQPYRSSWGWAEILNSMPAEVASGFHAAPGDLATAYSVVATVPLSIGNVVTGIMLVSSNQRPITTRYLDVMVILGE
ncbi:MAG: hypothetical protein FJY95_14225 [Candidatus Handelsmanbacteria bacterium]|nr:hypothetical protein [Candidatus Handelsmanbacteria bacterium]